MEFYVRKPNEKRKPAELIVLPFCEGKQGAVETADIRKYQKHIKNSQILKDFQGKEGELLFIYPEQASERRLVLLGMGKKELLDIEKLRRVYSLLAKACLQRKIEHVCVVIPHLNDNDEEIIEGIAEGLLLANYVFVKLKHRQKTEQTVLLKRIEFVGITKGELDIARRCQIVSEGVYLARDLVNDNADTITPQYLTRLAKDLSHKLPHVKTSVLDRRMLEKEKMGLLLAVSRGAANDPALIMMSYRGNPESKEHTVLIGKGITYDTGGLNLKPVASMETMKADMAGGAAVIGAIYAIASLGLKVNVTSIIPATENSIDAKSFKPGDVYKSYKGLMIEINNPDAEGRLVLADAITYAKKKLNPTCIIDIATLTGGIDIALGSEACGLFSNNDDLAEAIQRAGAKTFERAWRFPLYEEYRDYLKSDFGDMKNSGGRSASSIIASMFLQEFVEDTPWAHLDIASVAYLNEKKRYHPKYGTGFGVRLLISLLSEQDSQESKKIKHRENTKKAAKKYEA